MTTFDQSKLDRLANEVLTLIEISESRLLNWGFVSPRSDVRAELPDLLNDLPPPGADLWAEAQTVGVTADQILRNLEERRLIFTLQGMYRSRFAEAVRLLYLLRQLFPNTSWLNAPRLTSDMRIQLQRRRYPRRDIAAADLLAAVAALDVTSLHLQAVEALMRGADGNLFHLAQFQQEAIFHQLRSLQERGDRALVIGAGTGAGKTKAFYIPALAQVAAEIDSHHSTKAIAIYPRVELLKDQLAEAYSEVRKLDGVLQQHRRRSVTIGAYYADTPQSAQTLMKNQYQSQSWRQTASKDGWICPFMPCPNPDCERGELVWSKQDVQAEVEANQRQQYGRYARLRCTSCGTEVSSEHLLLTRDQLVRQPPDLLFTTTEMLNRRLSRAGEHALFGIGVPKPPRLVLLDEIHTYEGLTGAQVAYVLRRWQHARGYHPQRSLNIVGLSATLTQAEQFFAQLTGIPPYQVSYIFPSEADLVEEGIEYNLVLKGDPVSGTSLLSTSVQAVMLLGRILDTPHRFINGAVSRGAYGEKIFAFTDKLDVINRWYHIEQDAETRQVLGSLRAITSNATSDERQRRFETGQLWSLCEHIGHDLQSPLILDLTSSQSRGVNANANLVIATSTLEVGFNDPAVGAVVQHKAPRSMASFLQRKGRAGRTRTMRPWMVVITSAYGRDRWAFQHAESLFSPVLSPLDLPLGNYYVRKIQAGYALMDWLALMLKHEGESVDVWQLLSSNDSGRYAHLQTPRTLTVRLLTAVLQGTRLDELKTHLRRALDLQNDERALNMILWGEPRPLLMEVLPTLLRQLESNWQSIKDGKPHTWSDNISTSPMPDFVPSNLFSTLNLPELTLHIPDTPRGTSGRGTRRSSGQQNTTAAEQPMRDDQHMTLLQGMVEFAPGHVSKRYAHPRHLNEAHWLELPDEAQLSRRMLPLQHLNIDRDPLPRQVIIDEAEYLVYRPRAYTLGTVPTTVKSTSSARLNWRSQFVPQRQGALTASARLSDDPDATPVTVLCLHRSSPWRRFFPEITAYTQANGSWVEITRMAVSVQVETRYERGTEVRRLLYFEEDGKPAALGFSIAADAIRFDITPLHPWEVLNGPDWPQLRQHLCPEYLYYRLQHDIRLAEAGLSTFDIGWLYLLEFSMLIAVAVTRGCDLPTAAAEVQRNRLNLAERALDVIFQRQQVDGDADDREGRLYRKLIALLEEAPVQEALHDNVPVLWAEPDDRLAAWLSKCYAASLGALLFAALTDLVPDIEPDELVLDIEEEAIWISEAAAGGVGLITRIVDAIAQRPRELDLQLFDTLRNCEREQLAVQLDAVASLIGQNEPDLAAAFASVRTANDLPSQNAVRQLLAQSLEANGIPATRELIVALNAKFLRPNSGPDTDALIALLAERWHQEQERIACAIDLRVMSVAALKIPEIKVQLQRVLHRIGGTEADDDESQHFNLLQSLLWLNCVDSCPDCIEQGQPFQTLVKPSRALIRSLLEQESQPVIFGEPGWDDQVRTQLTHQTQSRVVGTQEQLEDLKRSLLELLVTPIEVGYQLFYPFVERITRDRRQWIVDLIIRELSYS